MKLGVGNEEDVRRALRTAVEAGDFDPGLHKPTLVAILDGKRRAPGGA